MRLGSAGFGEAQVRFEMRAQVVTTAFEVLPAGRIRTEIIRCFRIMSHFVPSQMLLSRKLPSTFSTEMLILRVNTWIRRAVRGMGQP
jgi:hypothetical protein